MSLFGRLFGRRRRATQRADEQRRNAEEQAADAARIAERDAQTKLHPRCLANPLMRNGRVMAVIRPENPALALAKVRAIQRLPAGKQDAAFNRMLGEQAYTFVGVAMTDQKVRDPRNGEVLGVIQPGDSFVSWATIHAQTPEESTDGG